MRVHLIFPLIASLWLSACGGGAVGGGTSGSSTGSQASTVTLSANPLTVASGGSTTLTWSSTNATSCTASGAWSGTQSISGSQLFSSLTGNKTYTLTCTGGGGSGAPQSVTVTVGGSIPPAPTLTLTANPATVNTNGSSTLTWSTANASSCTASGAWSGSKPTSGSQSVGPLTANSTYNLSCTGTGGSANRSVTITVGQASSGGALTMPSLDDERNAYRKWGLTWSPSAEPGAVTEPVSNYYVTNVNIHYDSEGDDLWSYLMMYRRTGNPVYLNRAQAWLRYFKNEYRTSAEFQFDKGFLLDHMYGWGLVAWYEHTCATSTCDSAALTEAENLAAEVEAYWSMRANNAWPVPGQFSMGYYGLRQGARHLLLATRVAELTKNQRWVDLRDKLIDLWLQSPDWDSRGMYFYGSWDTNELIAPNSDCKYTDAPSCPYQQGARVVSAFQIGILSEAFAQAYRTTGRTALRDRVVTMAKFVDQYALEPTYQYAASKFGIVNGAPWYTYTATMPVTFWDPVYTTSLVNTLVLAYKYTGDRTYYDRAKHFFLRGMNGIYGEPTLRSAPDNVVSHFVDTKFASATGYYYLDYNKGELRYSYLIFENDGL